MRYGCESADPLSGHLLREREGGKEGVRPVTGRTPWLCLEGYSKFCLECAASALGSELTEVVLEAAPVVRQTYRICRIAGTRRWMIEHVGRIDSQLHTLLFSNAECLRNIHVETRDGDTPHRLSTEVALFPRQRVH